MNNKIAFFGHHKCASSWVIKVLYEIAATLGQKIYEKQTTHIKSFEDEINNKEVDLFISPNTRYLDTKKIHYKKGFHVIRDPRDICVSGYFSHKYTHAINGWEGLGKLRNELLNSPMDEGLFKEMEFSSLFIEHIQSWNYDDPKILTIKMEEFILNPLLAWLNILKHLELFSSDFSSSPIQNLEMKQLFNRILRKMSLIRFISIGNGEISESELQKILDKLAFEKLTKGRSKGEENVKSHYRKGAIGDWKNYFNENHKNIFKEKYGELLITLGYEKNYDW